MEEPRAQLPVMFPLLNRFLLHFDRFFFKIKSEESKMSISWYNFCRCFSPEINSPRDFQNAFGPQTISRARALLFFFLRPHLFSLQLKVALRAAGQPGKELGIIKENTDDGQSLFPICADRFFNQAPRTCNSLSLPCTTADARVRNFHQEKKKIREFFKKPSG